MALNIKNVEVEKLAGEVAVLARESKTEAIRKSLEQRKQRLKLHLVKENRADRAFGFWKGKSGPICRSTCWERRSARKKRMKYWGMAPMEYDFAR